MIREGTRTVNCLTQLPEVVSESHTEIIDITPTDDSQEEDSNAALAARYEWDQDSDGTLSQRSRRSEDTENPHQSSTWGGWGFTKAYLDARDAYL
jgi:hypothetical protein